MKTYKLVLKKKADFSLFCPNLAVSNTQDLQDSRSATWQGLIRYAVLTYYRRVVPTSTTNQCKNACLQLTHILFQVPLNYSVLKIYTLKKHKCNVHDLYIKYLL